MGCEVAVYLSPRYDADLIDLYNQLGKKNFHKIAQLSVKSIVDPNNIDKIKEYLNKKNENSYFEDKTNILIRLTFNNSNDDMLRQVLNKIKPRRKSGFVKQLIRFYIGPATLLPLYFDESIQLPLAQTYQQLIISGISNPSVYHPRKRTNTIIRTEKPINTDNKSETTPVVIETPKIEEIEIDTTVSTNENEADEVLALLSNLLG